MSHRKQLMACRVVHKSTGGILPSIPEPVDAVGNAAPLKSNTVALSVDGRSTHHKLIQNPGGRARLRGRRRHAATFDLIRLAVTDLRDQRAGPGNNPSGLWQRPLAGGPHADANAEGSCRGGSLFRWSSVGELQG